MEAEISKKGSQLAVQTQCLPMKVSHSSPCRTNLTGSATTSKYRFCVPTVQYRPVLTKFLLNVLTVRLTSQVNYLHNLHVCTVHQ